MKKKITALIIILIPVFGYAQSFKSEIPITGSYFGETLVHPGIYIGSEYSIKKSLVACFGLGSYLHYKHHVGLFLSGEVDWRKTFKSGYVLSFGIGIGYLHAWPHGGEIYTVDDNGDVESKTNWGRPSLMPSLKLGLLSWDFRQKDIFPCRIFADIVLFGQYPYNDYMMPHAALSLGLTYYLKPDKNE